MSPSEKNFTLESLSFRTGEPIPPNNTGDGINRSPALHWAGVPGHTEELLLICEDPDAPQRQPFVHWVLYKIPPSVNKLPEGVPLSPRLELPPGALQGRNSFGTIGYSGPLPPRGDKPHRYFFKLFALDAMIELPEGASKEDVLDAARGHIVAEAELLGKYSRPLKKAG